MKTVNQQPQGNLRQENLDIDIGRALEYKEQKQKQTKCKDGEGILEQLEKYLVFHQNLIMYWDLKRKRL